MENEEMDQGQATPGTTMTEPDAYGGYAPDVQTEIQRFNSKRSSTRNQSKVDFRTIVPKDLFKITKLTTI